MTATLDITEPVAVAPARSTRRSVGDISPRMAGVGALAFAGTVIVQNLVRGAGAPTNGASAADVLAHYTDHRAMTVALVMSYVIGAISLVVFLGGTAQRLMRGGRPGWAVSGLVGATGVTALFAVVVGCEQALSVLAHRHGGLPAVDALWSLHNSVFAVLDVSIALALLGLSRAGVAAGITPKPFRRIAPVGSLLLVVGTFAGPAIAAGDAMPLFGLAGLGFVIWLAFLLATGLRLIRTTEA